MATLNGLLRTNCLIALCVSMAAGIFHERLLIWSEKVLGGPSRLRTVRGLPESWADNGVPDAQVFGGPAPDGGGDTKTQRSAMGFQYASQEIVFADVGYKELFRVKLEEQGDLNGAATYNVTLNPVYSGLSHKVGGVAVDWVAHNIYWTDSLYNWISVAAIDKYSIHRHLLTDGLEKPFGIAVHPKKGYLFWTDQGAVPKIERSGLDGSDRRVLTDEGLVKPRGMALDYGEDRLYWVDDWKDTIEGMDLEGHARSSFKVEGDPTNPVPLFMLYGIAVDEKFFFVSDQFGKDIKLYTKDTNMYFGDVPTDNALPYDVMIYDESLQETISSECDQLNCEHMCLNLGEGQGRCACGQEYVLQPDDRSCSISIHHKPQFVYSVGHKICSSSITQGTTDPDLHPDSDSVFCFDIDMSHVTALAFDVRAELLFMADDITGAIERIRMEPEQGREAVALQTGHVRGMAVDWINSNLYWTDQEKGHVMVSQLDGSLSAVVVDDVTSPRGVAVDPHAGYLYWAEPGAIYRAFLDGSEKRAFVSDNVEDPDGMVLDLVEGRLYWVDNVLPGIDSIALDGTARKVVLSNKRFTYRDVTAYQDFLAWTDGGDIAYFGFKDMSDGQISGVRHLGVNVTHDIITYDEYLQPLAPGPCDMDNGGCEQLCLPRGPTEKACGCATGFHLTDGRSCRSALKPMDMLLFLTPLHKNLYQLGLENGDSPEVQGLALPGAQSPGTFAYQPDSGYVYWYETAANVFKRKLISSVQGDELFYRLNSGDNVVSMDIHRASNTLVFLEGVTDTLFTLPVAATQASAFVRSASSRVQALAVDNEHNLIYWAETTGQSDVTIYKSDATQNRPNAVKVITLTGTQIVRGLGVSPKGDRIYWWTQSSIRSCDAEGHDVYVVKVAVGDSAGQFLTVAVDDGVIYYSTSDKDSLVRYDVATEQTDDVTDVIFPRVADIKVVRPHTVITRPPPLAPTPPPSPPGETGQPLPGKPAPGKPAPGKPNSGNTNTDNAGVAGGQVEAASSTEDGPSVIILAASSAGAVVVLVVIVTVVCVVMRRRRRQKASGGGGGGGGGGDGGGGDVSLTRDALDAAAHDNPTYMRADEVPARRQSPEGATEDGFRADGGDTNANDENYPTKDGSPFPAAPSATPPGGAVDGAVDYSRDNAIAVLTVEAHTDANDDASLVNNMAEESQVVVDVTGKQGRVTFAASTDSD